ncbi:MAG: hypothetical protein P4L51_01205 [Puia sp.]|nr:hypothetical protein [Puia sp.]
MKKDLFPLARICLAPAVVFLLVCCRTNKPAASFSTSFYDQLSLPDSVGFHKARYDARGKILPWVSWDKALSMEMDWYDRCPVGQRGYPLYFYCTFLDGNYRSLKPEIIPCTQLGMGILSYLKYYSYLGKSDRRWLEKAQHMGRFLAEESLTADTGLYPLFPRSSGDNTHLPIRESSQVDLDFGINIIEPDKGGIAGYAWMLLYDYDGDPKWLQLALHTAGILVRNMRPGDAWRAPWPFRVDAVTGKYWGERNADMVFILRLFDKLIERGHHEFDAPRKQLWDWIVNFQLKVPDTRQETLWVMFFEDKDKYTNRNSWAPMEMARYLIEKKDTLDPHWKAMAERCIQFAVSHFTLRAPGGATLMVEQDDDFDPWGGVCSKLGGVAALFYAAGGGTQYREIALRNLNWMTYFVDNDGCPSAMYAPGRGNRGGWQEDCHTDKIHNFVDALVAVPALGLAPKN